MWNDIVRLPPRKSTFPSTKYEELPQKWCYPAMDTTMSIQTKHEVLAKLRARYARAGHDYKGQILDQVVDLSGLHRKSAIRRLARPPINFLVLASYSANGGFLALSLFVLQPSGDESHADTWQARGR